MTITTARINGAREVVSEAGVVSLLSKVDGESASMVTLERDGRTLTLAGGPERFIVAWDEEGDPPYYTLLTDNPLDEPVYLTTGGQLSDYPAEGAVLRDEARLAAVEFIKSGERTTSLGWREE